MSMNTNTTESIRKHVVVFGKALEFATGIRAMAAEKLMRERGITDPEELFQACEELIGAANLFESYSHPLNAYPNDLVLGQGCPFPSLEAYIGLREHYGNEWPMLAMKHYVKHYGTIKLGRDVRESTHKLLDRAQVCFNYDRTWHQQVAADGLGRYDRSERLAQMNAYLAAATYQFAA